MREAISYRQSYAPACTADVVLPESAEKGSVVLIVRPRRNFACRFVQQARDRRQETKDERRQTRDPRRTTSSMCDRGLLPWRAGVTEALNACADPRVLARPRQRAVTSPRIRAHAMAISGGRPTVQGELDLRRLAGDADQRAPGCRGRRSRCRSARPKSPSGLTRVASV